MAERTEITEELERLALHCRPPLMSVEDRVRWLADWCEDLRSYDIEPIRTACKRWREGVEAKFPRQGQLVPMIRAATVKGEKTAIVEGNKPWRPLTDEEYQQLTLSDKIRHCRILAQEAYSKAGPQGLHTSAEDMPESWKIWRGKGHGHDAEAQRLNKILQEARHMPVAAE